MVSALPLASRAIAQEGQATAALTPDMAALSGLPFEAAGGAVSRAAIVDALSNQTLYLETFINGVDSDTISPYRLVGGALYADPLELQQLGFRIDPSWIDKGGLIPLSNLPGLLYRLDTLKQTVEITVDAAQLEGHRYDASAATLRPTVSPGVVLNYDAYGQHGYASDGGVTRSTNQLSGLLDLRAFAPAGTFTQTGLLRRADPEPLGFQPNVRLDTTLFHSDAERLDTWRAGDVISGASLAWVTPVRLGGLQWQRNFALQPNLVTFPLPTVSGSAAVPSSVDVLVNNVHQYSRPVEPGPFQIDNVPVITGQGEIQVVVRDALGREQLTTLPFYAAPSLLRPGWLDWSLETGYLRRNYAVESNDYEHRAAALGSVRAGVTDWLTLEGHGEGTSGLGNGGVGAAMRLGLLGVLSTSVAGSSADAQRGTQWSAAYQWSKRGIGFNASTRRASSGYRTLAEFQSGAPPARETTQASVSGAVGNGGLSLGYVAVQGASLLATSGATSSSTRLATVAYTTTLFGQWSLQTSVFRQLGDQSGNGGTVGLAWFFGNRTSVSTAAQYRQGTGTSASLQASQSLPAEGTGEGWRMQGQSGAQRTGSVAAGYRFDAATAEIGASDDSSNTTAFASLRGAMVSMDYRHWPMLTNPIRDSFALVDTVMPHVTVFHENRAVGRSDAEGLLLIPNLTAQTRNQLSIDPRDVPLDAEIGAINDLAVPLDRSGVFVKFPVAIANSATVILQDGEGKPLPVGAAVTVNGNPADTFTVGYDGQAYVKHLTAHSTLDVDTGAGRCEAELDYAWRAGVAQQIGPLTCKAGKS